MFIDGDKCIGCESCINWCPMGAIRMGEKTAVIDPQECVECNVCRRVEICPVDAFVQKPLEWPRSVRAIYSDPLNVHKETGLAGRGTEEIKTNDVTGRFRRGQAGVAIEVGRPGIGAKLKELEKLSMALARYGVEFEPKNPLTNLINTKTGQLPAEIREEKVLSAIIEVTVEEAKLIDVLAPDQRDGERAGNRDQYGCGLPGGGRRNLAMCKNPQRGRHILSPQCQD